MNIHIHIDIYEGAINYFCKENKNWKNLVGRYAFAKRDWESIGSRLIFVLCAHNNFFNLKINKYKIKCRIQTEKEQEREADQHSQKLFRDQIFIFIYHIYTISKVGVLLLYPF